MNQPTFIKNYKAGAAINKGRIVKVGADDNHVIQGVAITDSLVGVIDLPGPLGSASTAEDRVDIVRGGEVDVEAGGTITRGDLITSDSVGKGITAAPATGANARFIGYAVKSAVSGDFFPVMISFGSVQG